jgi:hypothetical protein
MYLSTLFTEVSVHYWNVGSHISDCGVKIMLCSLVKVNPVFWRKILSNSSGLKG